MRESSVYDDRFYSDRHALTRGSAEAVIAALHDFIRPKSVVDLGCGVGTWLATFKKLGCDEILGVDGDYVNTDLLEIPRDCFRPFDLSTPIDCGRRFELAMSLEVAEHVAPTSAETFVRSLTRLSPVVMFSAAIPFQGGLNHVNEQWPQYWSDLFKKQGFVCIDALRRILWSRQEVLYWYRQNVLLFVEETSLRDYPALAAAYQVDGGDPRSLIHPENYLPKCNLQPSLRSATLGMIRATGRAVGGMFTPRSK